jgi:hypothetical protein
MSITWVIPVSVPDEQASKNPDIAPDAIHTSAEIFFMFSLLT